MTSDCGWVARRGPSPLGDRLVRRRPGASLLIALLIAYSSLKLVREAFHGLMEGVPLHLSLEEIGKTMAGVEGVISVHDLHIWSLTAERIALSAHVVVRGLESWPETLIRLKALLAQRYNIEHVTLQPEFAPETPTTVPPSPKEVRTSG